MLGKTMAEAPREGLRHRQRMISRHRRCHLTWSGISPPQTSASCNAVAYLFGNRRNPFVPFMHPCFEYLLDFLRL